ncbi:SHOCT domain-containing protein [Demequina sediminicola]|uniref:SHOCT domain-containing protein n=1 Tax=Demequina sediminicola TaxID=1095026 RepID=UPI000A9FFFC1|nr:SHOCT domain-containing protein [Demequina sediminicola]
MDFFADFLSILLFTLWIFVMVAFFVVIIRILMDIFRDHDLGGFGKTLWVLFVIFLPVLGALVYLIARGKGMAKRDADQAAQVHKAQVEYTKGLMSEAGGASEIKAAKELLDSGAITQEEFDALKAKAIQK